jgi:hypothetical protein
MDLKAISYGHVVGLRVMRESRLAGTCRTAVAVAMRSSHPLLGGYVVEPLGGQESIMSR